MQVDYRNVEDGQSENPLVPAGQYEIIVVDAKENINQNTGNLNWIIKSKIISGKYKDFKIDDFNTFSSALESANKGMFRSFGFPVDTQVLNIEPENLIGKQALITIFVDLYKGKKRNKVERFGGYQPITQTIVETEQKKVNNEKEEEIPF